MAITFKKATREQAKARIALIGPSGSGKTYSALMIAHVLGKRIAVIDTEHGSARKYAGRTDPKSGLRFEFDVVELDSFSPDTYVETIEAAQSAGYDALVIDSLSHAWMGKDGALEQVDKAAKRSQSGNSFAAWRDITPKHNRLVEAMVASQLHLVVTMRSKMEYVLEEVERNGRKFTQPKKVGLAPIQRDGLEYEFDVVGDVDLEHNWVISKTRCPEFDGAIIEKPGTKFAETYRAWLQEGVVPEKPASIPPPASVPPPPGSPPVFRGKRGVGLTGKPLAEADLATLQRYRAAVATAADNAETPERKQYHLDHLLDVDAEITAARADEELANESAPPDGTGDAPDNRGDEQLAIPAE